MKFLHASDLLIGVPFPQHASIADRLRNQRLTTLGQLLVRAKRDKAEFILLTGNTLADNRLLRLEVKELASVLSSSAVPIFLLPGQTDPFAADSPYRLNRELFGNSLQILSEEVPVRLAGCTLYPCPIRRRGNVSSIDWIPPRGEGDGFRVGLACNPGDVVITQDLDYLALGGRRDSHNQATHGWCGTPEATGYAEERGHAQMITLLEGSAPSVQTLRTGQLLWQSWQRQLRHVDKLQEELAGIKEPGNVLLRLTLTGKCELDALEKSAAFLESVRRTLFHLEIDSQVQLARQDELYHHPLLRSMLGHLVQSPNSSSNAAEEELQYQSEVRREAILRLRNLVHNSELGDLI